MTDQPETTPPEKKDDGPVTAERFIDTILVEMHQGVFFFYRDDSVDEIAQILEAKEHPFYYLDAASIQSEDDLLERIPDVMGLEPVDNWQELTESIHSWQKGNGGYILFLDNCQSIIDVDATWFDEEFQLYLMRIIGRRRADEPPRAFWLRP